MENSTFMDYSTFKELFLKLGADEKRELVNLVVQNDSESGTEEGKEKASGEVF